MANGKKKKVSPPRPKKKGGTRTGTARNKLVPYKKTSSMALVHKICSLSDPFCVHANGAKYPDASSIRTLPYTFRGRYAASTTPAGEITLLFNPSYGFYPITLASAGVVPAVTAWTNAAALANITGVSSYRIISTGIKITNVANRMTSSGILQLRTFGNETISSLSTVDVSTYNASRVMDIPINEIKDLVAICPHTAQLPQVFYPVSVDTNNISTSVARGFQPITIYVSGGPANLALISIEFVINYELAFEDNSGMAQLATPPATPSQALVSASNTVLAKLSPFFEKGVKEFGSYVGRKALVAAATYMGGPYAGTATNAAMIMDVD